MPTVLEKERELLLEGPLDRGWGVSEVVVEAE